MEARIVSFRRGRHTYKPRQFIIQALNKDSKNKEIDAEKLIGKQITWKSSSGKEIIGKITATHGKKGLFRALFEKGLPGQAITTKAEIKE